MAQKKLKLFVEDFKLNQKIDKKDIQQYMADLLEKNDSQAIDIERGKLAISILKQMNNHSRLLLDAAKHNLKKQTVENL